MNENESILITFFTYSSTFRAPPTLLFMAAGQKWVPFL